ncbi:type II toxin-antitoxin system RelE/ParE family toxin [Flavobacterium sp. FlaQc-52]|jgi:plasmid stabilization system protein ParE|uniref:type II toxin-antitoxin system RelE/ParE family toxin n=1 Tax=Flavobacterium sp. FlaQc-52 TaxID=3374185 RepID=UPI00375772BB
MVKKEIIWSPLAKLQLENILEYYVIQNESSTYSLKILSEIEDLLNTLSHSELIGRLTLNKITRVISMKVYLIFLRLTTIK